MKSSGKKQDKKESRKGIKLLPKYKKIVISNKKPVCFLNKDHS